MLLSLALFVSTLSYYFTYFYDICFAFFPMLTNSFGVISGFSISATGMESRQLSHKTDTVFQDVVQYIYRMYIYSML